MSLYVPLESCPCGRCPTSWGRGACFHDTYKALVRKPVYNDPRYHRKLPDNFSEIEAIALLWRHRADTEDGYSRDDEIEWYRVSLGRLPSELELASWGRTPIDWEQITTDEILLLVRQNEGASNPTHVRTGRLAAEAYARRLAEER